MPAFPPLPANGMPSNLPRSLNRLPGGGRDQNRAQKRIRSLAMSPGSAEVLSGNADVVFDVFNRIFDVEGVP